MPVACGQKHFCSIKRIATRILPFGYGIRQNITAAEDANQIELSKRVRGVLDGITLPDGFMMDLSHDASESIAEEMDKIYFRTALTILLLLVFVAVITANLRYLLIIAISLAVNMAIAFLAYYFLRVEIQLYSLAGITISLNLVIDNLIVMTEHVSRHRTLRAFSAVLAATLTTVGALTVVFFLDEKTLLSLKDFTVVVIVNLGVSLAVALFLVPALVERMGLVLRKSNKRKRRLVVRIYRIYGRILTVLCRFRWIVFIIPCAVPTHMSGTGVSPPDRSGMPPSSKSGHSSATMWPHWVDLPQSREQARGHYCQNIHLHTLW